MNLKKSAFALLCLFGLSAAACAADLDVLRVGMINDAVYGRLTPDQVPGILAKY